MALRLQISTGSTAPIYRQIVEQVRLGVATGVLAPGDALPSVRTLAEQLVVNPNTVARAYAELTAEGTLEGQAGRGMFVSRKRQVFTKAERLRRLEQSLAAFVNEAAYLDFSSAEIHRLVDKKLSGLQSNRDQQGV